MPLEWRTVEVLLEGLSQKDDRKATAPGRLSVALNVEFDKTNSLNKRRGYTRVPWSALVGGESPELTYATVATYRDELVVYGLGHINSVVARSAIVDDAALVRRGPTMRGNYRTHQVFSGPMAEYVPDP
jgi:hypothetical protein